MTGQTPSGSGDHDDYRRALEVTRESSEDLLRNAGGQLIEEAQAATRQAALEERLSKLLEEDDQSPLAVAKVEAIRKLVAAAGKAEDTQARAYRFATHPIFAAYAEDGAFILNRTRFTIEDIEQLTGEVCAAAGAHFNGFGQSLELAREDKARGNTCWGEAYRAYFRTDLGENIVLERDLIVDREGDIGQITLAVLRKSTGAEPTAAWPRDQDLI